MNACQNMVVYVVLIVGTQQNHWLKVFLIEGWQPVSHMAKLAVEKHM